MGGIAALARDMGLKVTGWDQNVYPPMSTQLESLGIEITDSFETSQFNPVPDLVIVGNALSRGHPLVEFMLNEQIPFMSGPEWLGKNLLRERNVLAVAGTHGKTTTASMLVNILEDAGLEPGFLVGGVVRPFEQTARLGGGTYFVIEADEYDTAFFDKRSKFVHYYPDTFVINNLEFDHADIFPDLAAIQRQFSHGIRMVPGNGHVIVPQGNANIDAVLEFGCWSKVHRVGSNGPLQLTNTDPAGEYFTLSEGSGQHVVNWQLQGQHNTQNALMAAAAAHTVGVSVESSAKALSSFHAPARRMEVRGKWQKVTLYDDFAHHPTALQTTVDGLRKKVGPKERVIAIFEPRSNTMKVGIHKGKLAPALKNADEVYALKPPGSDWLDEESELGERSWHMFDDLKQLVEDLQRNETSHGTAAHIHWLIMSNGSFGGIHQQLISYLTQTFGEPNEI